MLYNNVKNILIENGWFQEENEDLIWFNANGQSYAVVKRDQEKNIPSLCIISTHIEDFPDGAIPDIFFVAANVNNRHFCARVAMHSSIYEEGLDHHFLGFEFHAPKSCLGDVSIVIDTAVKELSAIMDDFYAELDRVFPS